LVLTHPALKTIAVLAVAGVVAAGRRTAAPLPSTTPVAPPSPAAPTVASVGPPVAFHVRLDADQTLSLRTPPADCPGLDGGVRLGPGRHLSFFAYSTSCDPDTSRPGNGHHGVYRTAADIPADRRAGAVTFPTALGEATAFLQPYYECTNSCRDYTEPVAVITLDHPSDPAYPALVVCGDKGSVDLGQLTTLLKARISI
jgi:hypothetical protein